jgi:hypothetical protein
MSTSIVMEWALSIFRNLSIDKVECPIAHIVSLIDPTS